MPSAFNAYALGIPERSFIKNPAYKEILNFGKLKEDLEIKRVAMLTKNFGRRVPKICSHHATYIGP